MGAGNLVLAYDTPENREVAGGAALLFDDEMSLARHLQAIVDQPRSAAFDELRARARERVDSTYSWDAVVDAYLALFQSLRSARR
jgi:glycosyltransferase involved in cell wall biosynthesis